MNGHLQLVATILQRRRRKAGQEGRKTFQCRGWPARVSWTSQSWMGMLKLAREGRESRVRGNVSRAWRQERARVPKSSHAKQVEQSQRLIFSSGRLVETVTKGPTHVPGAWDP